MQHTVQVLAEEKEMQRVGYYFNVRKAEDPPLPNAEGKEDAEPPLQVVLYKGQRRKIIQLDGELPLQMIKDFFQIQSEEISDAVRARKVPHVSSKTIQEDVVLAGSTGRPVLLQMYEDTCFLCFLMRPFINSLAEMFQTYKVPITFKRLNIEKNDFPDGCPVARGTPTFVYFKNPDHRPQKLEEFKPKDLCERIKSDFPRLPRPVINEMDDLQELVSKRFRLFTQLVMWTVELQKLDDLSSRGFVANPAADDDDFNNTVSRLMVKDMQRADGIRENLEYLQTQVDEIEHDACVAGAMMAENLLKREAAEFPGVGNFWSRL